MKLKTVVFLAILIITRSLFCQIRIYFDNVKIYNNGDVLVSVSAQNVGSKSIFWVSYGTGFFNKDEIRSQHPIDVYEENSFNFHVYYKDILNGQYVMKIPSSITIQTIFGNYIEMDQPTYEMPSTGSRGQKWQIFL